MIDLLRHIFSIFSENNLSILIVFPITAILIALISSAVIFNKKFIKRYIVVLVSLSGFSLFGLVIGKLTTDTLESTISSVLPAVLGFIGGIVIFITGTKGAKSQMIVSLMIFSFSLALITGAVWGQSTRRAYELAKYNQLLKVEEFKIGLGMEMLHNEFELERMKRDYAELEKYRKIAIPTTKYNDVQKLLEEGVVVKGIK